MPSQPLQRISVFALVLLITGAIDSIRNLPATALFGSSLVFFFIFGAVVFLIPIALISAELSSTWSEEEGGVYSWVQHAFGTHVAFFTIWLQWINTIVWYPAILLFIAGTLAYLINPALAQHKGYLVTVVLGVFWSLTFLGMKGLKASARFAGVCTILGMIIPMMFIIGLAIWWVISGHPLAIHLHWSDLIPNFADTHSWISLTAIMTSFLGMELAAVHVRNVNEPQRNFPKAILLSAALILITMILGSLAIAVVLPTEDISLVRGIMQAFTNLLGAYHLSFLMPLLVILILLGSLGSMVNWIISPVKGLLLAADHGYLPHFLYRRNENDIAYRILILQGVLITLFCSVFVLFSSVNAIYWFFTALSTELYVMMYVLMFIAAIRLKYKYAARPRTYKVPGGRLGYYLTCLLGLFGCGVTLFIGFFPPEESLDLVSVARYQVIFACGLLLMLLPASVLYIRRAYITRRR